jgi:hypothetical protein
MIKKKIRGESVKIWSMAQLFYAYTAALGFGTIIATYLHLYVCPLLQSAVDVGLDSMDRTAFSSSFLFHAMCAVCLLMMVGNLV